MVELDINSENSWYSWKLVLDFKRYRPKARICDVTLFIECIQ